MVTRLLAFTMLAGGLLVGAANAQPVPAKKAAPRKVAPRKARPTQPQSKKAHTHGRAAGKAPAKAGCGGAKTASGKKGPKPLPLDGPPPKWVCDVTKLEMEPVWHGAQIKAGFTIKNEGEGNLKIKAKGG